MSATKPLPELHQSILDASMLDALFSDLEACANIIAVIPKFAMGYISQEVLTLEEGQSLFREGKLRGLQVRYQYQGDEWWDTLIAIPNGARITRIKQEFK